jgi:hypothetical protein
MEARMSKIDGSEFFSEEVNSAINNASVEETNGNKALEVPGIFRMKVVSKKWEYEGKTQEFPRLEKSENKGSLMCKFILETVEDVTDKEGKVVVPAGSYTYENITLAPAPGAGLKKVQNTMKMLKPRLGALVGKEHVVDFKFDFDWVKEYLTADFKKTKDGNYTVSRDHKMVNEVMCKYVVGVYQNKPTLNLKSIKTATDEDESVVTGASIAASAEFVDEAQSDLDAIDALASGETPEGVPEVSVF